MPSTADSVEAFHGRVKRGSPLHLMSFAVFIFTVYLSIGLPLAVLPPFVHLRMGLSTTIAGLMVSLQYIATLVSRPWAGRISDHYGARISVLWGLGAVALSGLLVVAAALLHGFQWVGFGVLILSRLALGIGESMGSTGSTLWGMTSAGPEHTARVIGWAGISTYSGVGLGAPLGVILDQRWGLGAIGGLTVLVSVVALAYAWSKGDVEIVPGEHLPFTSVLGRVAPHGMALALGQVAYSTLATFVTLFYAHRHWQGAALCLTAFGAAFIFSRVAFIRTINRWGGFRVAKVTLVVEALGALLLWQAASPAMALAGATVLGLGFSLVFPSIGVEAVKRVPEFNRGTALAVYTAFADVSFFMVGPVAGALIGFTGYPSIFLFSLASVLVSLGIVTVLRHRQMLAG